MLRNGESRLLKAALFALAAAGFAAPQPALSAPPPKVTWTASPGTTTPGGVTPGYTGNNATYGYALTTGTSLVDNIPVKLCAVTDTAGWTSFEVNFNPSGSLPGVTVPPDVLFTADGCQTVNIVINSGALGTNNYTANINIQVKNQNPSGFQTTQAVDPPHFTNEIHLKVAVAPPSQTPRLSCFLTDSSNKFLSDCSLNPVTASGSDQGRFAINANRRNVEVSTNPGQFYVNLIWQNPLPSTVNVDVNVALTGFVPHGAQSLHAMSVPGYLTTISDSDFNLINTQGDAYGPGTPTGGSITNVPVLGNGSLLLTFHLEWGGLSKTVPTNCGVGCQNANQLGGAVSTVSVNNAALPTLTCGTSALGYLKQ